MKHFPPNRIIFLFFLLFSVTAFSQTDTREQLEQRRRDLQEQISRINGLRSSNLKKERSVLTEVEELDQQIRATENLIRVTNQQANLLTREIASNEKRIISLEDELEALKTDYSKMIRRSYKSKSQQSRIMFLLSSENFLQAYKRLQYMKQYANYRQQQGEEIEKSTLELQELNESLAEQKKTKDALIAENRQTRAGLQRDKEAQQGLIAIIRKKESQFAAEIREKQQTVNEIDREIERIIEAAIAASNRGKADEDRPVFALTPEAKELAADFEKNKGKLPWPVKSGVISMRFGSQPHPIVRTATISSNGLRIDTEKGGKARSIFGGVVSEVLVIKGSNKAVMVRHGDYISVYNNLDKISVKKGDEISIGEELGTVATSKSDGKTTLHFVLYKNTQKLNPEHWIL